MLVSHSPFGHLYLLLIEVRKKSDGKESCNGYEDSNLRKSLGKEQGFGDEETISINPEEHDINKWHVCLEVVVDSGD